MHKKDLTAITISGVLVIIDLIIKSIIASKEPFIDLWLFSIHFVTNTGASFGIFQGNNIIFICISLIVLGAALFYYNKITLPLRYFLVISLGGVLSNLIDRIVRGFVVDYIDFGWWPVFNIADSMIVVGAIIMAIILLKEDLCKKKKSKKTEK